MNTTYSTRYAQLRQQHAQERYDARIRARGLTAVLEPYAVPAQRRGGQS